MLSSQLCQSGQTRGKTYKPGETRTQDHAFCGHLLTTELLSILVRYVGKDCQ